MEYDFSRYHGARLVNVVITFLRKHGVKNPFPPIPLVHSKKIYYDDFVIISFIRTTNNRGFFEIYDKKTFGIIRTPIFFYYSGRRD